MVESSDTNYDGRIKGVVAHNPYSKFPGVEPSERDDLVKFTADKLKAQSDELLHEFTTLVGQEEKSLGSLAVKSYKLM